MGAATESPRLVTFRLDDEAARAVTELHAYYVGELGVRMTTSQIMRAAAVALRDEKLRRNGQRRAA